MNIAALFVGVLLSAIATGIIGVLTGVWDEPTGWKTGLMCGTAYIIGFAAANFYK